MNHLLFVRLARRSARACALVSFVAAALVGGGCSSTSSGNGGTGGSTGGTGGPTGGSPGGGATVGSQCDQIGAAECQHILVDCTTTADAGGATVGDQCKELGRSLCAQATTCGSSTSADACMTTVVTNCCGNSNTCDAPAASGEDAIQACATALSAQSCTEAAAGTPPACSGVIKPVATPETKASCANQMHQACCGNTGTCAEASTGTQESITACTQAITSSACGSEGSLPASCHGVVKPASEPIHVEALRAADRAATLGATLNALH